MDYNPFSLKNKIILVTGASSGIGQSIAIQCSRMGAKIVACGRNEDRLKETISALDGDGHLSFIGDLTLFESIHELVGILPVLDGIVLSAGTSYKVPFKMANYEKFENIFKLNFFSPVELLREIVKGKKIANSASVIAISSVGGEKVFALGSSIYGSSKAALSSVMRYCAVELSNRNIRVNMICPANVETPLLDKSVMTDEQKEADRSRYLLRRYGKPEEIAYAAIYLLSDASSWVTGTSLVIDGGASVLK